MPLPERIEEIITMRQSRVGGIKEKIEKLQSLKGEITNFERLRGSIIDEQGHLRDGSPYESMLLNDPEMVKKIALSTAKGLIDKIIPYQKELERLEHIYSRDSISILVFGFAGAGKSTLIQTITGLGDDVVMTTDDDEKGRHCTGASSFIYNDATFEARVYFYTQEELLKRFNNNFLRLQKKYLSNGSNFQLKNFADIATFKLADYGLPKERSSSVSIYHDYFQLIDRLSSGRYADGTSMQLSVDTKGNRFLKLTLPEQVQPYVAQINGRRGAERKEYNNYLAVKRVDVFTHFPNSENVGKIVLMDNVGLGDVTNQYATENTMYESIAANSDAVVFLFCPPKGRQWEDRQTEITETIEKMRYKVLTQPQVERMDEHQLFMLVNNKVKPGFDNSEECQNFKKWFNGKDQHQGQLDETCIIVNAKNQEDTANCLNSVLTQMIDHLPDIDSRLKTKMDQAEDAFLDEFNNFIRKLNDVTLPGQGSRYEHFDERFTTLYTNLLRNSLKGMLDEAKERENEVSIDLHCQLRRRCTSEKAEAWVSMIEPFIADELQDNRYPINAYLNVGAYLRHAIPDDFRKVDVDFQRKIDQRKAEAFDILYRVGRMSTILHKDNRITDSVEGTLKWARKFSDNVLKEGDYPLLHGLFNDLLEFHQNVEGFLLPKVFKHLDKFEKNQPLNMQPDADEAKRIIRFYLETNLMNSFEEIRKELDNFVQAPNEAVYYVLAEFADGLIYNEKVKKEARKLYLRNYEYVWEEDVKNDGEQEKAFKDWTDQKKELATIKDFFENK